MELGIDSLLKTVELIQKTDFKQFAKTKLTKAKDIKTGLLRSVGKINKSKYELMTLFKSLDKINNDSIKDYKRIAEETSKARIAAVSKYTISKARLKIKYNKGMLDGKTYKQLITAQFRKMHEAQKAIDSSYFKNIQKIMDRDRIATKMVNIKIFNLKHHIDMMKKTKQKNIKIAIAVSIAVIAAIAIGVKIYSSILKSLKNPCKKLDTSEEKKLCNIMADIDGLRAKIITLKQQSIKCNLSEDPVECESKINKEIEKSKKQIEELQTKLDSIGDK